MVQLKYETLVFQKKVTLPFEDGSELVAVGLRWPCHGPGLQVSAGPLALLPAHLSMRISAEYVLRIPILASQRDPEDQICPVACELPCVPPSLTPY